MTGMVAEVVVRTNSYDLSTDEAIPWKKNLEQLAMYVSSFYELYNEDLSHCYSQGANGDRVPR